MNTIGFAVEHDLSSVWAGRIRGDKGRDREDCAVVQARHAGLGRRAEKTVEEKHI